MADISQTLIVPRFVKFHDGGGKSFVFLVTKEDPSADGSLNEYSGAVWCDDEDNAAGLSQGWNARTQIGRGDPGKGASWSPFQEGK